MGGGSGESDTLEPDYKAVDDRDGSRRRIDRIPNTEGVSIKPNDYGRINKIVSSSAYAQTALEKELVEYLEAEYDTTLPLSEVNAATVIPENGNNFGEKEDEVEEFLLGIKIPETDEEEISSLYLLGRYEVELEGSNIGERVSFHDLEGEEEMLEIDTEILDGEVLDKFESDVKNEFMM